jgi:hypothetical protein
VLATQKVTPCPWSKRYIVCSMTSLAVMNELRQFQSRRSLRGYDEPEILPSSTHPICLTRADGGQSAGCLDHISARGRKVKSPAEAGLKFAMKEPPREGNLSY